MCSKVVPARWVTRPRQERDGSHWFDLLDGWDVSYFSMDSPIHTKCLFNLSCLYCYFSRQRKARCSLERTMIRRDAVERNMENSTLERRTRELGAAVTAQMSLAIRPWRSRQFSQAVLVRPPHPAERRFREAHGVRMRTLAATRDTSRLTPVSNELRSCARPHRFSLREMRVLQ